MEIKRGHAADCPRFEDLYPWQCECRHRPADDAGQSSGPSKSVDPRIEIVAVAIAKRDGLDLNEVCGYDLEDGGECDSDTCIAAHHEDHDADHARAWYRSIARTAVATIDGMVPIVIYGPSATGKTLHQDAFAAHYGCTRIVAADEGGGRILSISSGSLRREFPHQAAYGDLILSNAGESELRRRYPEARLISINEAREAIGLEPAPAKGFFA